MHAATAFTFQYQASSPPNKTAVSRTTNLEPNPNEVGLTATEAARQTLHNNKNPYLEHAIEPALLAGISRTSKSGCERLSPGNKCVRDSGKPGPENPCAAEFQKFENTKRKVKVLAPGLQPARNRTRTGKAWPYSAATILSNLCARLACWLGFAIRLTCSCCVSTGMREMQRHRERTREAGRSPRT